MEQMAAYHHPPPAATAQYNHPHYPTYPPPPQPTHHMALQYHQQPPPAAPYQPPPLALPQQHYQDGVKTLFIAGLPEDVKYREIYNLFREFPGFHSCQLKNSGQTQAYAFAVFSDQQTAVSAMQALNGLMFDLELESTLHVDLAKSNSKPKRSRTDGGEFGSSDKKVRGSAATPRGLPDSGVITNINVPGLVNSSYNPMAGYPSTRSIGNVETQTFGDLESMKLSGQSTLPSASSGSAPCATLFVANLGPTCSEEELTQVFSRFPGFLKVKMQTKRGLPVAFADFQDIVCSTGAINHLQGSFLRSSDGEGMRLEYARTRMGLPRRG